MTLTKDELERTRSGSIECLGVDLGAKRRKGILPELPPRECGLRELRAWLTLAFSPPDSYQFDSFTRHGRKALSSATVTLIAPAGNKVEFFFEEQRDLSISSRLRASVVSITNGLCRMPHLSGPESSDVWTALCSLAYVADQYDDRQETIDWVESFLGIVEPLTGHSLEEPRRYDALAAMRARGLFERRHARLLAGEIDEHLWDRRPVLLVDEETSRRHARVGELATYVRHVIGVTLGHGMLDSRVTAIGGERLYLESRNGAQHPHMHLYRLPERGKEEA